MNTSVALFAGVALLALPGPAAAQGFRLVASTFGSAGGAPTAQAGFVLGATLGQPVTGGGASASAPRTAESAGFWRWAGPAVLGADEPAAPDPILRFALYPVAPNPFAATTLIRYAIPTSAGSLPVTLRIFDLSGRVVRTLESGLRASGLHAVRWDGRDDAGQARVGGIYFCRITAGPFVATRRLVLVR